MTTKSFNARHGITVGAGNIVVADANGNITANTIVVGGSSLNSTAYAGTANNATYLNGQLASYYTNASNLSTGTLSYARIPANVVNTSANFTIAGAWTFNANVTLGAADHLILSSTSGISANGSYGSAGQMLTSNGTAVYWMTPQIGDITAVTAGSGLTGGGTSGDLTVSVLANTGIVANATGLYVNATYIGTLSANNATYLNGQLASYYTNASNITTGTLPYAQIPANIVNTTAAFTYSGVQTYNANVVIGSTGEIVINSAAGISANGTFGSAGQMLTSNGTAVYWSTPQIGDITAVTAGSGLTGGGTSGDLTINIGAGTGITVNADDIAVNAAYIATLTANAATYSNTIIVADTRNTVTTPETASSPQVRFDFKTNATDGLSDGGLYFGEMTFRPYGSTSDWSGGPAHQLGFTSNNNVYHRSGTSTTWGSWARLYKEGTVLAAGNTTITGFANVSTTLQVGGLATFNGNVSISAAGHLILSSTSGISANGSFGTAGHTLHSNGTAVYWAADDQGVTSVATGNGLTGGTITSTGTVSVLANTGIVANTTGLFVNSAYIATVTVNNADKWTTARTLSLSGDASGSVSWDGSANATLSVVVSDDSHSHSFNNLINKTSGTGTYTTTGDFRAPIFYDSNDTNYYIDPNSTSQLNSVSMFGLLTGRTSSSTDVNTANDTGSFSARGNTSTVAAMSFHRTGAYAINMGLGTDNVFRIGGWSAANNALTLTGGGSLTALTDVRAPIFYDSNDTNYRVDLASTSVANNFTANYFGQRAHGAPRSNLGDPTVTEMALFQEQFNNKTEFYPPANVIFETSTDGNTWTEFSVTEAQKKLFVGGDSNATVNIAYGTAYFRVRFVNNTNYVYLNALYSYWSANGHTTQVQIYKKKFGSTTWEQHTSSTTAVGAWPGHLWLPFSTIPFRVNNTDQYDEVAIVFIPTWNATYPSNAIQLYKMQIWGGYPAGKRTLYSVDSDRNATFPAVVSANTSVNAPTFYDSDNTGFYVNASGVSSVYRVDSDGMSGKHFLVGTSNYGDVVDGSTWYGIGRSTLDGYSAGNKMVQVAGYYGTRIRTNGYIFDIQGSGGIPFSFNAYGQFSGSVRAPLFYDSDNTSYYLDAASTSNLNGLTVASTITGSITGSANWANFLNGGASSVSKDDITTRTNSGFWQSSTGTAAEGWPINDTNWQHLISSTHSNVENYYALQLAAGFYTQGLFYRSTNGSGTTAWSRVALYNNAYGDNLRATIFYDNDNTAYYIDAASTSNLNNVTMGGTLVTGNGISTGDAQFELGGSRTGNGAAYIDWHSTASSDFELRLARYGGANGGVDFLNTGTGNFSIGQGGAAPILFLTSGSERMRIDSSGNVGIGLSVPTDRLDVNGRVRSRGSLGVSVSPPSDFWGTDGSTNASLFTGYGSIGSQGSFGFDITANGYRNSSGTWTTLNTNGSTSAAQIRLATGDGSIIFGSDATKATGSSSAVTERMRITSAGTITANADFRAPIFYDSNNTAYYIDAASTSNLNAVNIAGNLGVGTTSPGVPLHVEANTTSHLGMRVKNISTTQFAGAGLQMLGPSAAGTQGGAGVYYYNTAVGGTQGGFAIAQLNDSGVFQKNIAYHSFNDSRWSLLTSATERLVIDSGGVVTALVDMRAPIFYDSNNTAYYANPASTSLFKELEIQDGGGGNLLYGATSGNDRLFIKGLNYTHALNLLDSYNTSSYAAISGGYLGQALITLNGYSAQNTINKTSYYGSDYATVNGTITGQTDVRAPIFYDSNNTAYYFDGAGTSVLNQLTLYGELNFVSAGAKYIDHNGDMRFRYSDNSTFYNERIFIAGTGNYTQFSGSARAPLFYDTDNTAYYFDGAGTTVLNGLNVAGASPVFTSGNFQYHQYQSPHVAYVKKSGGYSWYWRRSDTGLAGGANEVEDMSLTEDGNLFVRSSARAPIFYDSNNTAYYANPAGSSVMSSIALGGATSVPQGAMWVSGEIWVAGNGNRLAFTTDSSTDTTPNVSLRGSTNDLVVQNWSGSASNDNFWVFGASRDAACAGNITAYYSDERLKTKTGSISDAINKVMSLEGFTYVENELAKSVGYNNQKQQVGVSAQKVQAVLPEAVALAPFDYECNDDGTITSKSGENYLTVDYSRIVPLLIEAIKEQQLTIEQQSAKINMLEDKLDRIIQKLEG